MSESNNRIMPLIAGSQVGDNERAIDILNEIHAVLKKHGCVLQHQDHAMVLAKVSPGLAATARALAVIQLIAPDHFVWAEIKWTPEGKMKAESFRVN